MSQPVVIQNGKVVGRIIYGGDRITIQELIQPGDSSMEFQTYNRVNIDPITDNMNSFSPSIELLSSQTLTNNRTITFDKQEENATPSTFTNKGTYVEAIGTADNIQGLTFGIHTNYKQPELMPVYWDLQEPYVEYKEGKGLSNWNWLASPSFIENVYPTPVERDGVLHIKAQMAMPGRVHFDIIDYLGRKVVGGDVDKGTLLMPSEQTLQIPLAPLGISRGMYILRLHPENANEFFDAYAKFVVR